MLSINLQSRRMNSGWLAGEILDARRNRPSGELAVQPFQQRIKRRVEFVLGTVFRQQALKFLQQRVLGQVSLPGGRMAGVLDRADIGPERGHLQQQVADQEAAERPVSL